MLEALTGAGLATSAGLNAYIPLLAIGVLSRYTDVVSLPAGWGWLGNGWVILILGGLLLIEVVADKVPVLDSANDVVQTVVRPTAGGLAFGAGTSTATVSDPGSFFGSHQWVPVAVGVLLALGVHGIKATARPVVNVGTAGVGAPIVSTLEDIASVVMSVIALLLPVLILLFLVVFVLLFAWALRRRGVGRRRTRRQRAA
ncbi:DUF4126 domain-containing protein [Asanoa iriomotensis]|uniref:Membrane protein n=1 Tax=Asanoa iriomotensis TaxID=234613 RepID=A0ABQ4BWN8_9ACTN|nr:DUF4126 domain-containing protein [Asanoa iriomotensis]GIF54950.1 membrane protein [Asanoa iriomotensis]